MGRLNGRIEVGQDGGVSTATGRIWITGTQSFLDPATPFPESFEL